MKRLSFFLFLTIIPLLLCGQVTGVVVNSEGMPLVGVVVQSVDGGVSTTTDFDGYFELNVPEGTQLQVAFFGYKSDKVSGSRMTHVELYAKGAKPKRSGDEQETSWSMFVLANGMTSVPFSPAIGLTIGMVRRGGWYINAMTGFGFKMDDAVSDHGMINGSLPFYTSEYSKQTFSVTAGGLARLGKWPVYVYAGLGWAYKSITYETNDGKWIAYATDPASNRSPLHSLAMEAGLMANIKGFAISVGYEPMIGFGGPHSSKNAAHEIKIGLGGMFDLKRRAGK